MPDETSNIAYSKPVLDLVTVCVEFCATLENSEPIVRKEWVQKMTRLLPMIYLKVSLLPDNALLNVSEGGGETFVREEDYVRVAAAVSNIMGDDDVYLDVFVEDMKYSERPVSAFVSENIADIYQDLRNFVSVYQYEMDDRMNDALAVVVENFRLYWGQKLVNVLRQMHTILYTESDMDDDSALDYGSTGEFWS